MTKRPRKALLLLVALIMALALPATTVMAQEGGTLIAEGFNAPQGILVGPSGNIWVVDAGVGGETEIETTDPVSGEETTASYGETSRIVRIDSDGTQTVVATLPSVFVGDEATGGSKLALLNDELYVTSGFWLGDGEENPAPTIPNTAAVLKLAADGTVEQVAPTWRIEKRMNPDNTIYESHPYGIAAGPDEKLWVVDAAANTLLRIDPESSVVELVTTFPAIPGVFPNPIRDGEMLTDPVPTGIDFDDDGNAYVSLLSGAPLPGSASVVMVTPGGARETYATALTMLTDLRRGPDGEFYAVQFAVFTDQGPTPNSGAIIKIAEGEDSEPVVEGLSFPTSIDFDDDGNAYITINGAGAPGTGAVVMYEGVGAGETYAVSAATEEETEEATEEPTEEATAEPTDEETEEATPEATEEATEEATPEVTEEATEEATPEATEEATEEATPEVTEEATEEATVEAAQEATPEATAEPTEDPTEEATPEVTEEATEEATPEATEEASEEATPEVTEEVTEEATAEPIEEATPEPTEEATQEATPEATEEVTEEPAAEAAQEGAASVEAADQESDGMQVTVDLVVAAQDGWIVIHADADGRPGVVLGQTAVAAGTTENVIVMLDESVEAGSSLWAMLHVDEGVQGVYEFPGSDVPVQENDDIVMVPFTILEEPTEEATAEATEEALEEPTAEATVEAMEEPTAEATEEVMEEPTAEAAEEVMEESIAEATEEPTEEATAEATEEAMEEPTAEATEEAMEESMAEAAGGEKGAPERLPNTGAAMPSVASIFAIVMAVVAALAGGVSLRRRQQ